MDMYLTAIGCAMLEAKADIRQPASAAEEDAYYAKVSAPILDPWVGRVIARVAASLIATRGRTAAASRQPARHA